MRFMEVYGIFLTAVNVFMYIYLLKLSTKLNIHDFKKNKTVLR